MRVKPRWLISVSGGRTSALMAKMLWDRYKDQYDIIFVFANTSREKEETLIFVNQLTTMWGLPIVWVEAVVHHGNRIACTHKIVNFETAKRDGSVFEEVIKKYGIPNKKFRHCTRELKTNPIRSYARSIGWGNFLQYTTIIGFRADEPGRVNFVTAEKNSQWYPLFEWGIKKSDVAVFWLKQDFDLQLEDWEGNCKLCRKKSKRKLLTAIYYDPTIATWHIEMEPLYEQIKPEKKKDDPEPVRFFRENESIHDLIAEACKPFNLSIDRSLEVDGAEYDFDLDEQEDCAESCEPFGADEIEDWVNDL